jgi:pimeloyl-ACP methyl ester carboxylesterase
MRTPLVLVSGLLCDARLWEPQCKALADIAMTHIADHSRHDSMAAVAKHVLAGIGDQRFALAGLSMGGYIALEIFRQAPERVARLALLDTSARADTPEATQARLDFIALAERGRLLGITAALLPRLIHPDRLQDAALVTTIKEMAQSVGKEGFIRQERAIISRVDSRALLRDIRCPTLVLCGREDRLTTLDLHVEMARDIPQATFQVIERCGHLSTLERPIEVTAALRRWLAQ